MRLSCVFSAGSRRVLEDPLSPDFAPISVGADFSTLSFHEEAFPHTLPGLQESCALPFSAYGVPLRFRP